MHQKLGYAYTQRANADEAWREYSHALQLMQEDPRVDRSELLCLYMCLAELSTRWLGWFNTPPDMQQMRSYIDAGLKLLEGQQPSREHALFLTYQAMWYTRQLKTASPAQRASIPATPLPIDQQTLRSAIQVHKTMSL